MENDDVWSEEREAQKKDYVLEIPVDCILKDYDRSDLKEFTKDLLLIFRILKNVDIEYGEAENIDRYVSRFEDMARQWNKKYRDVLVSFTMDGMRCRLDVFFDRDSFSDIPFEDMASFEGITRHGDEIEVLFDGGNTLTLAKQDGKIRLIYLDEDMLDPSSPEFRLCAYFALTGGFEDIDLQKYADDFSFRQIPDTKEYGWHPSIRFKH